MNNDDKKKIYAALSAPLPDEAIQRTDGSVTGRGYSTTGYGYIWIASRLTAVLGLGNWITTQTFTVRTSTTQKGRTVFDATCELTLQFGEWHDGVFVAWCEVHGTGGHNSTIDADARKGSYTNAFKKAAGMAGVGKAAFEGTIDDDNTPMADRRDEPDEPRQQRHPPGGPERGERNRLTSKQLAALWTLAKKLDVDRVAFRNRVRERFGVTPEFLSRDAASSLISELSGRLGNGHARDQGEQSEVA